MCRRSRSSSRAATKAFARVCRRDLREGSRRYGDREHNTPTIGAGAVIRPAVGARAGRAADDRGALFIVFGLYAWQRFTSDEPVVYADIEEHFKYGSTGGEHESGFPYWIFQAMPQVCAQHLPGPGYASLGMIFEEGNDLPVGMSKRRYQGIDRTFLNCAVCHASTVRDAPRREATRLPRHAREHLRHHGVSEISSSRAARIRNSAEEYVVPEVRASCSKRAARIST